MLDTRKCAGLYAWRGIIGEWSSGTLRPADLLEAAVDCARAILRAGLGDAHLEDACREARAALEEAAEDMLDEPALFDAYDTLTEAIDNLTPYAFWTNLEGDGAAIGLFPDVEGALEEARNGELPLVEAGSAFPEDAGAVLTINDHGNVALYLRDGAGWVELWGVV